jgi:hypothetical protein
MDFSKCGQGRSQQGQTGNHLLIEKQQALEKPDRSPRSKSDGVEAWMLSC